MAGGDPSEVERAKTAPGRQLAGRAAEAACATARLDRIAHRLRYLAARQSTATAPRCPPGKGTGRRPATRRPATRRPARQAHPVLLEALGEGRGIPGPGPGPGPAALTRARRGC